MSDCQVLNNIASHSALVAALKTIVMGDPNAVPHLMVTLNDPRDVVYNGASLFSLLEHI